MLGQHDSRTPYSVLHTDRPSSAEYVILSAEEVTPEQLGARLHLMSDDMGNYLVQGILLLTIFTTNFSRSKKKSCFCPVDFPPTRKHTHTHRGVHSSVSTLTALASFERSCLIAAQGHWLASG